MQYMKNQKEKIQNHINELQRALPQGKAVKIRTNFTGSVL